MKETLEVGDVIRVLNTFNNYLVTVIIVTKTKAVCKTPYNNEIEFTRSCKSGITPYKKTKWNTTYYTLVK